MHVLRFCGALALCLTAASTFADDCEFEARRTASIELNGAKRVVISAGPGELKVDGLSGRTNIDASGRACASSQALLDEIRFETKRTGDAIHIRTVLPDSDGAIFANRYAYLDVTIEAPADAHYTIEDSSGDLTVSAVRSAKVIDSSGDARIERVAGDLEVVDSSGEIIVHQVAGNLRLTDSSGDVRAAEVRGDVEIQTDSSGDLQIERVAGSVRIAQDSSGEILVRDVRRDVTIEADTSGDIHVERIGGAFTVGADGSGSISHERVSGAVRTPES